MYYEITSGNLHDKTRTPFGGNPAANEHFASYQMAWDALGTAISQVEYFSRVQGDFAHVWEVTEHFRKSVACVRFGGTLTSKIIQLPTIVRGWMEAMN